MAYNKPLQECTVGDFFQLIDGKLFLKITGGEYPNFEGYLCNDPSKWVGNDELYKGNGGSGLVNVSQRQMGPYRIEPTEPETLESYLAECGYKLVDGQIFTAQPEEVK